MTRSLVAAFAGFTIIALVSPPGLAAQGASPYLPLDHRAMPFIEHLIRAGVLEDPLPLTRPLRRTDVLRVLARADTSAVGSAGRDMVRALHGALSDLEGIPRFRFEMYGGGGAGTAARRDPLRQEGNEYVTPFAGAVGEARWNGVMLSSHGHVDLRMNEDPDYRGRQDRWIAGRFTDAYLSVQGRYAELTFGAVSRNWGPVGVSGAMLSNEPYSYDHLFVRVGAPRARLEALVTELDPMDVDGERRRRFWAASRFVVTPATWFTGSVQQASLWSGVGRGAEPWWINPLKLTSQTRQDEPIGERSINSLLGLNLRFELPGRVVVQGEFLLDDLSSVLSETPAPDRIAQTLVADVAIASSVAVRASYTLVSSLTYRRPDAPDQSVMRAGVGLGRNFADYTQLSLEASVLPWPRLLLTPQLVWLRQGEGDFRKPFPPLPAEDHPFLFEGTVERTLRLGLAASLWLESGLWLGGDLGWHDVGNAGHVAGASASELVGRIALTYHVDFRGALPR